MVKLTLPYIATFLAFREVPFLVKLIEDLRSTNPSIFPQIILVDGNGFLHPRGFGLACHLGVLTGVPTIGIGKTFLMLDGLTIKHIKDLEKTLKQGGDVAELKGESGIVWGAVLKKKTTTN
jgi:deoxyinosine 3'endonuclease (endonuclease V)